MKKVLAVFLALVMLLGVSACAGSPTTGTNDAEQPSTGADQSASMGAENNANKSTTEITYVTLGDTGLEKLKEAAAVFEQETGIKVNFESWSYSDAYSKILTLAEAGNMPDAMYGFSSWTEQFKEAGYTVEIGQYISEELYNDFTESAREVCSVNGELWAMPSYMSVRSVIINKDAFASAGLPVPTTWEEMLADCAALCDDGYCQYAYTMVAGHAKNTADCFLPILWAYGADVLSEDQKSVAFNTPEGVAALQMYVDLAKYSVPDYGEALIANTLANFGSQIAAAHLANSQAMANLKAEGKDYSFAQIIEPLKGPGGEAYSYGVMDVDLIFKTGNEEAAGQWLEFWHQTEYMGKVFEEFGFIPNQKSFYEENPSFSDPANDLVAPFAAMVEQAKFKPTITCWEEIQKIFSDYVAKAVLGQMTAEEAFAAAETECNAVLAAQ